MKFGEALEILRNGGKIKCPEWEGYWFKKGNSIWVCNYQEEKYRQRDVEHIYAYMWRTDWEEVK